MGLVSDKGQSPTTYHFSPLYPQNDAGTYNIKKNRTKVGIFVVKNDHDKKVPIGVSKTGLF